MALWDMITSLEYTPPGGGVTISMDKVKEQEAQRKAIEQEALLKKQKIETEAAAKEYEYNWGTPEQRKTLLTKGTPAQTKLAMTPRSGAEQQIGAGYKAPVVGTQVVPGTPDTTKELVIPAIPGHKGQMTASEKLAREKFETIKIKSKTDLNISESSALLSAQDMLNKGKSVDEIKNLLLEASDIRDEAIPVILANIKAVRPWRPLKPTTNVRRKP